MGRDRAVAAEMHAKTLLLLGNENIACPSQINLNILCLTNSFQNAEQSGFS